jgi:hypothetical protein
MHINRDGGWLGPGVLDVAPLRNSERRQAIGIFSFVSGRPLTDVVTAVQPERRRQKLNPPDTLNLAPHMAKREFA